MTTLNIDELIKNPDRLNDEFEEAIREHDLGTINLLVDYVKDPWLIYLYALQIVKGRVNERLENIIAQNPWASYWYAHEIIKGPWSKGEDAIAQDDYTAYGYVTHILKRSWPKGEDAIIGSEWERHYLKFLESIGELENFYKRHPEVKSINLDDPSKLKRKFVDALFEKNKEVADLLVNYIDDPWLIYKYAKDIVGGKVSDKLEDIIASDPAASYHYAVDVLKAPFPKGEEVISKDYIYNTWYKYKFFNK